ncbi:MAG: T9SS type A sorting domain-containing protein [Bacteroidota bacterium]
MIDSVISGAFEDVNQALPAPWAQRGYQYENARRRLAELIAGAGAAPPTGVLEAVPDTLPAGGGAVTLSWSSMHATGAFLSPGIGPVGPTGSLQVQTTASTVYRLTLSNEAGTYTAEAPVVVLPPPPDPPSGSLWAVPDTLPPGGGVITLSWSSLHATSASLDHGIGNVPLAGSLQVQTAVSTMYRLTLSNEAGTHVAEAPVVVLTPPPELPSGTITAEPDTLPGGGGTSTLSWTSLHATSASLDHGIGSVPVTGSREVQVLSSSVYHLTLSNEAGSRILPVTVVVPGALPPPEGTLMVSPDSLPAGGGAVTLIWVSSHAAQAALSHGVGQVPLSGSTVLTVDSTTIITLTLSNPDTAVSLSAVVHVAPAPPPPTGIFLAKPDSLPAGGGVVKLIWVSEWAASAVIDNGVGPVPTAGSVDVTVGSSRTYALTLSNASGSRVLTSPVRVSAAAPPPSGTFGAAPDTLPPGGGTVTLSWTSVHAAAAFITSGIGSVPLTGSLAHPVTQSTTFHLVLSTPSDTSVLTVPVHVQGYAGPPAGTIVATPDSLPPGGGTVTLVWTSEAAESSWIDGGVGPVPPNGSTTLFVPSSRVITLSLSNPLGTVTRVAPVFVAGAPPAPTGTLVASPDTLPDGGGTVTLVWVSQYASAASLDNGIGPVPVNGAVGVTVHQPTQFALTLLNETGSIQVPVRVAVAAPPPAPAGTFSAVPDSLPAGGGRVMLFWVSTGASSAAIDHGVGPVPAVGMLQRDVDSSTVFRLSLSGSGGTTHLQAGVTVAGAVIPLPEGVFTAHPDTLPEGGGDVLLVWVSTGADSAKIDNGVGPVPLSGSVLVPVGSTRLFTIAFFNAAGSRTYSCPVYVPLPSSGPLDVTLAGIPCSSGDTSGWNGSSGIEVIRDGVIPPQGSTNPVEHFATSGGDPAASPDWIGYVFPAPRVFSSLLYQEGMHCAAGGWFEQICVQVRVGGLWKEVPGCAVVPPYGGNNQSCFDMHDIVFPPVVGDGIRITGPTGGGDHYATAAELRVLSPSVPPPGPRGSFFAVPDTVPPRGGMVTLYWSVADGSARLDGGIGAVPADGAYAIWVGESRSFTLTMSNEHGIRTLEAGVTVRVPRDYILDANYPNPFNPSTTIRFSIHVPTRTLLEVFDLLGRRIRTLYDETALPGTISVEWDGTNEAGHPQASGVYLYRVEADGYRESRKMLLLR